MLFFRRLTMKSFILLGIHKTWFGRASRIPALMMKKINHEKPWWLIFQALLILSQIFINLFYSMVMSSECLYQTLKLALFGVEFIVD